MEKLRPSIYDFEIKKINGDVVKLNEYKGKVILIVNTASQCGFTPQYEGLENLFKKYSNKNFTILAFPCNQFGQQEPGSDLEIKKFCELNYNITFPIFAKIDVNGDHASPLFQYLKQQASGILGSEAIKWNFTKFLVDKNGVVIDRFAPTTTPQAMEKEIEKLM